MSSWRTIQKNNFKSLEKLAQFLEWHPSLFQQALERHPFVLNLPVRLAKKIAKNTLDDPILLQFVPLAKELEKEKSFTKDPVEDAHFQLEKKLLKKYDSRALLLSTACAMHCRYCFRKNFDYAPTQEGFDKELEHIRKDTSLKEVILSGGDPFSLSDSVLFSLLDQIAAIPHVKRVRFHTRFLIGIPERITDAVIEKFASYPLQIIFILHINHAKELDSDIVQSIKKIQGCKIPILSQSVLLKGVNDTVEALQELFETLVDSGIMPYYLHQLDKVQGAAHFEVSEETGRFLIEELKKRVSGYAVPRYVREVPGEKSKIELTSSPESLVPKCLSL